MTLLQSIELRERYGKISCVNENELQQLTASGWELIAVLESSHAESVWDSEVRPEHLKNNGGWGNVSTDVVQVTRHVPVKRLMFLVGELRDTTMSRLAADLADARAATASALADREAEKKAREEADRMRDNATARTERLDAQLVERGKLHQRDRDAKDRLEADIGKIRAAIGEREMKRILTETG